MIRTTGYYLSKVTNQDRVTIFSMSAIMAQVEVEAMQVLEECTFNACKTVKLG